MRNLLPITNKQKEILILIYKFRFLTTNHLQIILNHKNPHRIQAWLKDLTDKKYIQRHYSRKTFSDGSKPAVYYLASQARHILKDQKDVSSKELDKVYKENKRSQKFISHCLSIVDIFLFFESQKKSNESLHFFTKGMLGEFAHFPDPLPDAYFAVKTVQKVNRYFLDLFEEYTPSFVVRARIKNYLTYSESRRWYEHTNSSVPTILLVLPNERVKKHIYWYAKSLLQKTFNDDPALFLAVKDNLVSQNKGIVWQKVEIS